MAIVMAECMIKCALDTLSLSIKGPLPDLAKTIPFCGILALIYLCSLICFPLSSLLEDAFSTPMCCTLTSCLASMCSLMLWHGPSLLPPHAVMLPLPVLLSLLLQQSCPPCCGPLCLPPGAPCCHYVVCHQCHSCVVLLCTATTIQLPGCSHLACPCLPLLPLLLAHPLLLPLPPSSLFSPITTWLPTLAPCHHHLAHSLLLLPHCLAHYCQLACHPWLPAVTAT
jgi:hypothetical protein